MARQDKRRGGEPCARDARGLVTHLREQLAFARISAMAATEINAQAAETYRARAERFRANIRWVLAARRAIERAGR
jgi:hypothetical protein